MFINEVCKECSLTKKAIEYYVKQGLISPSVQGNGYRSFSQEDVLVLKKVSTLRSLGVPVTDIRGILSDKTAAALNEVYHRKATQMSIMREKQELLCELAAKQDWEQVQGRLHQLQKKQMVLERFLDVFPGYYGEFVCLHFAPYLNEPVETDAQQEAFDTVIAFLDGVTFDIPDDLKACLDGIAIRLDEGCAAKMSAAADEMIHETEKYIADNQEMIESYLACLAYRQSEEYKASPACRLEKALRRFTSVSGYHDIFIPAMCRLSKSYQEYQEGLRKADEIFIQKYPELAKLWEGDEIYGKYFRSIEAK